MWDEKILPSILGAAFGALFGIVGSFIGFTCWPWLRRRKIRQKLTVPVRSVGNRGGIWCWVVNGSQFTLGRAMVYITIDHCIEDISAEPPDTSVYITAEDPSPVDECQVCWAVQEGGTNPMRIDVYAGEHQPLSLGTIHSQTIQFLSEQADNPSRVYLARKPYPGHLKIASADCPAKEFRFCLDPDARPPLTLKRCLSNKRVGSLF
jgi:hypothetical protein